MIIAVDFDGTCTTHDYPRIGRDIGAAPVLKRLVAADHRLVLWTMRSGKELEEAEQWFRERNIPLFGVNSCPGQDGWTNSAKPFAHLYIDDSALGCPLSRPRSKGGKPHVDWKAVDQMLRPLEKGVQHELAGGAPQDGFRNFTQPARPRWFTAQHLWVNLLACLAWFLCLSVDLH